MIEKWAYYWPPFVFIIRIPVIQSLANFCKVAAKIFAESAEDVKEVKPFLISQTI